MSPAVRRSIGWIIVSFLFGLFLLYKNGSDAAVTFYSVYLVEKLLSVDNLFVFYLIFRYFKIKGDEQRSILEMGVFLAYILRAICIFSGVAMLHYASWLNYVFGAYVIFTAWTTFAGQNEEDETPKAIINLASNWFGRYGKTVVLIIAIEIADIMFAFDSMPVSFAITNDAPIIFMANILAIAGLRSFYFVMLDLIDRFVYLPQTVGFILLFIGMKLILNNWLPVPQGLTLGVIVTAFIIGTTLSWRKAVKC